MMNSRLEGSIDDFIFIKSPKVTLLFKKSERGTHTKLVTVHRGGKIFQRKQRIGRKEEDKEIKLKSNEDKKSEWENWQQYYKDELFRPSTSPHEDYYSQAILVAKSPQEAKTLIRRYQAKDPSSMGYDLSADFEQMYRQTKDKIPKIVKKSSLHPDNLQGIDDLNESGIVGLVGGMHESETYICRFKDGSQAIHKTMMKGDIVGEVGAYETSKILGWDVVPETIQCDYGKGEGSTQKWIKDTSEAMDDLNEGFGGIELKEKHLNDLSKIFIMDMILGNFDRHGGNILIDKNDKCWAIDNEMWGKKANAELHIESLENYAKSGKSFPVPMMGVLENSFGNDPKMYQNFKDHVDKNIDIMLNKKDEIMEYWSQYKDSNIKAGGAIPVNEAINYIKRNIKYIKDYRGKND